MLCYYRLYYPVVTFPFDSAHCNSKKLPFSIYKFSKLSKWGTNASHQLRTKNTVSSITYRSLSLENRYLITEGSLANCQGL